MLIKINGGGAKGETIFRRKRPKDRKFVHEGGNLHLARMYAQGGMVVSVFNNYLTNQEETKYDSVQSALDKYKAMAEMRENSPEWVDEGLMPAILKAIRAAQLQNNEGEGIVINSGDVTDEELAEIEDVDEEFAKISAFIAEQRKNDPELDKEMTLVEMGK